jgi:hypothetical protein
MFTLAILVLVLVNGEDVSSEKGVAVVEPKSSIMDVATFQVVVSSIRVTHWSLTSSCQCLHFTLDLH